jgi:hypothetical protein
LVAEENHPKRRIRRNGLKVLKAAVKASIACLVYIIVAQLLEPVYVMVPGLQQMVETFTIIYVALMVIGDLVSGTLFQHVFSAAKALFVMAYLILSLNTGIFEHTFGSVDLIVDLRLFLVVSMLLGLLGLARSVLQAIDYVNERAQPMPI